MASITGGLGGARAAGPQGVAAEAAAAAGSRQAVAAVERAAGPLLALQQLSGPAPGCCRAACGRVS